MLCGLVLGGSAQAADLEVFKTSSGNIVCELDNGEVDCFIISGSADHVDGLPRARPVYLSKRTRFAPAAEGSALGQKRLRVLPMARKRNGGRSAVP